MAAAPARADTGAATPTPAEHVAALMAEQEQGEAVVVSELLAGEYDTEALEEQLRAEFGRLDTPFHVFAAPDLNAVRDEDAFLAALQDRLGEEGLYVYLKDGYTVVRAAATPGFNLPVRDAATVVMNSGEVDHGSALPEVAGAYVDALTASDLSARAEEARRSWELPAASGTAASGADEADAPSAWQEFLAEVDPNSGVGPENTGFLASLVAGALLGIGGTVFVLARQGGGGRQARITGRWWAAGSVLAAVAVVAAGAVHVLAAPSDTGDIEDEGGARSRTEPPYVQSTVRVDRLVREWESDPLYVDPLSSLAPERVEGLREEVADAPVPVLVAVVPMSGSDESGGDPDILAHALAYAVAQDGAYVVAEAWDGRAGVALRGVDADPVSLREAMGGRQWENPEEADPTGGILEALAGARLDPGSEPTVPDAVGSPVAEEPTPTRLERYVSEGFLPGLLVIGPLAGVLLCGALALVVYLVRLLLSAPGRRLRPLAHREAGRAAAAIREAVDHPGADAAVRDADTALTVLGGDPDELDLVGVVVLSRRVLDRLAGEEVGSPGAVCMVNPLHGSSQGQGATELPGGGGRLPMCGRCLRRADRFRLPLRVAVGTRWGVSHLSLRERGWVRTRYGTRGRLRAERLLEETRAR
ncbi:hypothetical protein NE857_20560 [Nocardiopsis exhalans]|uniref:TPM domain-containing protein n=1 Tax=Nocardiopsis exhalans TaxID=163604 RepID=A0ABY5D0D0_9ACTN|nr:hypothetical protein [Nocardiopsis exhalans]USY17717.1 hypothetical protein NE857_20560 [Nocardiopsis exhalans]